MKLHELQPAEGSKQRHLRKGIRIAAVQGMNRRRATTRRGGGGLRTGGSCPPSRDGGMPPPLRAFCPFVPRPPVFP